MPEPNPTISKITLPSGTTYDIEDTEAREAISHIQGFTKFLGVTTTALTDGASTNPIVIDGNSVTASSGDIATYGSAEFIFNGTVWQAFGDLSGLGALAYKDNASGTYTPTGNVSAPVISVDTVGSTTTVNSMVDTGTLPSFTTTVSNKTLTLGWNAGTLPTKSSDITVKVGDASYSATAPEFSGTEASITVS